MVSILKNDTFKVKIEKCLEIEKNAQVVTRANWADPNWQSYYEVVSSKTSCSITINIMQDLHACRSNISQWGAHYT